MQRSCGVNVPEVLRTDKVASATMAGVKEDSEGMREADERESFKGQWPSLRARWELLQGFQGY